MVTLARAELADILRLDGIASTFCSRMSQVTRRRETGAVSARSLLLTLLGEFVLPHEQVAWTGSVIAGLAAVDVEEQAARQALTRTSAERLLQPERQGRRVR